MADWYIIPKDDLTLTDRQRFRMEAKAAGVERAMDKLAVRASEELDVRGFENALDAGAALDQWRTAALAVLGTRYSCFQAVAAPTLANNRVAVFYKVAVETIPFPVSLLTFRRQGAVGNIVAEFDLEQLVCADQQEGYFTKPVVFDPTDIFAVQVMARIATGVFARVILGAWIIERKGNLIA